MLLFFADQTRTRVLTACPSCGLLRPLIAKLPYMRLTSKSLMSTRSMDRRSSVFGNSRPSRRPILEAYRSAVAFAARPEFSQSVVTREEYQEMGSSACRRKFRDWKPVEKDVTRGREPAKGKGARGRAEEDDESPPPATKKPTRGRGRGRGAAKRQS